MNLKFHPPLALLPLLLLLLVSGCSRYQLYDTIITWERYSAGLEPARVALDDVTIAYLRNRHEIDGEPLVLLHGFGASKDNWVRMAGHLTDDFAVYAPDLPGHGDSTRGLDRDYSVGAQVEVVRRFLDQLGLDAVHLAGNSMGGGIATVFAARYPERVRSIVLMDPAGSDRYPSELDAALARGNNPLVVKKPGDFERLVEFVAAERPFIPWPLADVMEEKAMARQRINEAIFRDLRASAQAYELSAVLAAIRAPTLIIWGAEDRVLNPRNAEVFVAGIDNARKVILDDVGHVPMLEVPERSAELVREFIRETASRSDTDSGA